MIICLGGTKGFYMRQDVHLRIKERLEQKMLKLQERLSALDNPVVLNKSLTQVNDQISELECQLAIIMVNIEGTSSGDFREDEVHLEHLLMERKQISQKLCLLEDKREQLQQALAAFQFSPLHLSPDDLPDPRKGWSQNISSNQFSQQDLEKERRRILELLQQQELTVEHANELLETLDKFEDDIQVKSRPRWVKIRVTDVSTNQTRINVTLPIGVVRAGIRAGASIPGIPGINIEDLRRLLNQGTTGHFVDLFNESHTERLEILIE